MDWIDVHQDRSKWQSWTLGVYKMGKISWISEKLLGSWEGFGSILFVGLGGWLVGQKIVQLIGWLFKHDHFFKNKMAMYRTLQCV